MRRGLQLGDGDGGSQLRIAFLLTQLSGYVSACLEALARLPETAVSVTCLQPTSDAPFDVDQVTPGGVVIHRYPSTPGSRQVLDDVADFHPDVLVVSGWQVKPFRYVARRVPRTTLRVLLMDNQWLATPKQVLGVLASPVYVRPIFDVAFLPGERQATFARKLGFPDRSIWRGVYTCNHPLFSQVDGSKDSAHAAPDSGFLFVGRLVPEKGLAVLAKAYESYRAGSKQPWPLRLCGTGPLASLFNGIDGVTMVGFVQPGDLARTYADARCLVMPSLFEPWGVAIHEATAAGLPVICSTACGAAAHLIEDGVNGYLVEAGNEADLAEAMARVSVITDAERREMSRMSRVLSSRYTPDRWASLVRTRSLQSLASLRNLTSTSSPLARYYRRSTAC